MASGIQQAAFKSQGIIDPVEYALSLVIISTGKVIGQEDGQDRKIGPGKDIRILHALNQALLNVAVKKESSNRIVSYITITLKI